MKIDDVFNYNRYEQDVVDLKVGDTVKICVEKESFWVEIKECSGQQAEIYHADGRRLSDPGGPTHFKGRIDNDLLNYNLHLDDVIEFNLGNIIRLWKDLK